MRRTIEVTLSVMNDVDDVKREYLVASALYAQGIPVNPLTQEPEHGTIERVDLGGGKRKYIWEGEDWRQ